MENASATIKDCKTGMPSLFLLFSVCAALLFAHVAWAEEIPDVRGGRTVAELNQLAKKNTELRPYEALANAAAAAQLSVERQDHPGHADALLNMGLVYLQLGDMPNMRKHLEESLSVARKIGYRAGEGNAHNFLGTYFSEEGLYDHALINYTKALEIRTALGDRIGMSKAINNLGLVYGRNGYPDKGIALLLQSIEMKGTEDATGRSNTFVNLGMIYKENQENEKALQAIQEGLAVALRANFLRGQAFARRLEGEVYLKMGRLPEALECLKQAIPFYEKTNYLKGVVLSQYAIGQIYEKQGNYTDAADIYRRAAVIAEDIGQKKLLVDVLFHSANVAVLLQNPTAANSFYKQSIQYLQKITKEEAKQHFELQQIRFETEKIQQEVGRLREENDRKELEKNYRDNLLMISVAGMVLLGVVSLYLRKQLLVKRRNERQLLSVTQQMQEEITERKRLEGQIQAISKAKSDFLANISHEIRNPLNALMGFSELSMSCTDPERKSEYLNIIAGSARMISSLINDVLDISRIESGKMELDCDDFDPRTWICSTLDILSLQAEQKGIDFVIELPETMPSRLYGDRMRLGQILSNIVGNAVKFTEQGHVKVSIDIERPGMNGPEIVLIFTVADTGIGISPEKRDKVFDVFSQAEASTTRLYGGSGLGAVISRQLVHLMGGDIGFESTPGVGTTFTFWVPFIEHPVPAAVHAELATVLPLRQMNILVVEDSPFNQRLFQDALHDLGQHVIPAEHGEQAVQYFREQLFDLVLMDVCIPGMNGHDATRAIREFESAHHERSPVIIIGITANARPEDRKACLESGMDEVLSKPVSISMLRKTLLKAARVQDPVGHHRHLTSLPETFHTPLSLQLIQDAEGDIERLKNYLKLLLADMGTQIGAMEAAYEAQNPPALCEAAHTVKGLSRALQDPEAGRIAENIENQAHTGNFTNTGELLSRLRTLHDMLIQNN